MKVVISSHIDTVFRDPDGVIKDRIFEGPCDNLASMLAIGRFMGDVDAIIELTNDEELHMDGARYVAREHSPTDTLIIVMDTTKQYKKKVSFTIENIACVSLSHVKKALKNFKGKYKINIEGEESEAWLYKSMGFCVVEIDIPILGGHLHSLEAKCSIEDIKVVAEAVKAMVEYFSSKTREELSDHYRVDAELNGKEN